MSSIKFEKILPCAVLVMLLLANAAFAQPVINTKTYNLFNASDAQYSAYKQMKNETVGGTVYTSTGVPVNTLGIQCFPSKWIAPNWTMQTWVNGTWNFSIYGYCGSGAPVASLFAKILKYNGTEYNPYNTTVSGIDLCSKVGAPGALNNWTYNVPYNSILNLSAGERVGVQFCINVTSTGPQPAFIQWEGTSPSNVRFTSISVDLIPPTVTLVSPANDTTDNDGNITFICNATDNVGVQNISLYVWNSSGVYYTNTKTVSGTSVQESWNLNGIPDGNYTWNCQAYDQYQSGWGNNNRTVEVDKGCYCSTCGECTAKLNDSSCSTVYVSADIVSAPADCIVWPTDGKILDCQGYTLSDDGTRFGIYLNGKTNNTIRNCMITDFNVGIYLENSDNNTITDNTLFYNTRSGLILDWSDGNTIANNTAYSNMQEGFDLYDSKNNKLLDNFAYLNNKDGIALWDSDGNNLTGNIANMNSRYGVYFNLGSNNNTAYSNIMCSGGNRDIADWDDNTGDDNSCTRCARWDDEGTTCCTNACGPDLISSISLAGSLIECEGLAANVTITNVGGANVSQYYVSLFKNNYLIGTRFVNSPLDFGETHVENFTLNDSYTCACDMSGYTGLSFNLTSSVSNSTPAETVTTNNNDTWLVELSRILDLAPLETVITVSTTGTSLQQGAELYNNSNIIGLKNISIGYVEGNLSATCINITQTFFPSIPPGVLSVIVNLTCAPLGSSYGTVIASGYDENDFCVENDAMPLEVTRQTGGSGLTAGIIDFGTVCTGQSNTINITIVNDDSVYAVDNITYAFPNLLYNGNTIPSGNMSYYTSLPIINKTNGTSFLNISVGLYQSPGVYNGMTNITIEFNNTPQSVLTFDLLTRVEVVDCVSPVIIAVSDSPDPQLTLQIVNITADVSDNINISAVLSEITYPDGTVVNYTMTYHSGTTWYIDFDDTFYPGIYNYTIYARDTSDNWYNSSQYTFTIIGIAPIIIPNFPPEGYVTNNSTINFNFTATDEAGTELNCSLYLDGILNQTNSSTLNNTATIFTAVVAEGQHNWSVSCIDISETIGYSEIRNFTVDTTPPSITLNFPAPGYTTGSTSVNFNWTAYDNFDTNLTCNLTIGGAVNASDIPSLNGSATNYTVSSFPNGLYYWNVTCWDDANNTNTSETRNFTVDATYPDITIQSPMNITYNVSTIDLNYTVSGTNIDTCSVYFDGLKLPITNCSNATLGAAEGPHNVTVVVNNTLGNTNSSTVYFTVDLTSPAITIQSPINTTYNISNIDLNYTVTDNLAVDSCWYYLNGAGPNNLTSCTNTTLSLADGYYNLTVFVNDTGGNQNSSTVSFTVDATPPFLSIQSPMNITYNTSTITLNYTVSDNIAVDSCWYYRDGAGPTPLPGCNNITLPAFADGSHYVTVYVNDTANNQYSPVVFFMVDTTPPAVTIQSPINTTYGTNTVNLDYTVSDNIAVDSCWYSLDGGAATPLASCINKTLSSLSDGSHYVTVFVNDTANNQNSSTVYFAVDTTFPIISIQSPVNIVYNISTVDLNYTTSNGNIDTCWYYLDGAGPTALPAVCQNITLPAVSDGPHNVTVYVNDTANNTAFAVAYFSVDTTPPVVTIQSPTNSTYNTSSVDLNYTASDNLALNSCWYVLDGGAITPLPGCGNSSLGPLANGQHNVTVFADDTAGNQNSSTVFFTINVTISPPPGGGNGKGTKMLDVVWEQVCPDDEIVINVTYHLNPVSNVEVRIIRYTTLSNLIDVVETDDDGQVTFAPTKEGEYRFYFSKSGYRYEDDPLVIDYTFCEEVCTSNTDCPSDAYCDDGECKSIECDCGYLENHQCVQYECCSDGDCAEGYLCENNECVLPPECENDADCPLDEYCSNGECIPVEGECGYVENHAWYDYECCSDGDCPQGQQCSDHTCVLPECTEDDDCDAGEKCEDDKCVPADYKVEAPEEVERGQNIDVRVTVDGEPAPGIRVKVTYPDGTVRTFTTDSNGRISVRGEKLGDYKFEVQKPGKGQRTVSVVPNWFDRLLEFCWLPLLLLIPIALIILYFMVYTIYFQTGALSDRSIALSPGLMKEFGLKSGDRVILELGKKESAAVVTVAPTELVRKGSVAKGRGRYILAGEGVIKDLGIKLDKRRDTKGAGFEKYATVFWLKIKKK